MRALAFGLVLISCGPAVEMTELAVSGTCAGEAQALVDGSLRELGTPVPIGTSVEARCTVDGTVVAWGVGRTPVAVPLWPVGSFVSLGATPRASRAGHTATLLPDGTVFVAGGYRNDPSGPTALATAELYVPNAFAFTELPSMAASLGVSTPRAFHTATPLGNGQVMMHGGETYRSGAVELSTMLIFDSMSQKYGVVPNGDTIRPRSHGLAVSNGSDSIFVLGGVHAGAPVTDVEVLDLFTFRLTALSGASLPQGAFAAGWLPVLKGVAAVDASGNVTYLNASGPHGGDSGAVSGPVVAAFAHGSELFVVGAAGTSVLNVLSHKASAGPALHVPDGSCTVALGPNAWVIIGADTAQGLSWSNDVYTVRSFDAPPSSRTEHTCTQLSDGSVLVLGGRAPDGTTLGDAWRFVPPVDWR